MGKKNNNTVMIVLIVGLAAALIASIVGGTMLLRKEKERALAAEAERANRPRASEDDRKRIHTKLKIISKAVDLYHVRLKAYPQTLSDLLERPMHLSDPEDWEGPYITAGMLDDVWGNRFAYAAPGKRDPGGYDVWSLGADGQEDSGDEIGDWDIPADVEEESTDEAVDDAANTDS